jgi:hypothetical protein
MNSIIDFVTSPEFWVGGVIVGFIISILGNLATKRVDAMLTTSSATRRESRRIKNEQSEHRIQRLAAHSEVRQAVRHLEIRLMLRSLLAGVAAGICMLLQAASGSPTPTATFLLLFGSAGFTSACFIGLISATKLGIELDEAVDLMLLKESSQL